MPKIEKVPSTREPLRFHEWERIYAAMDDWYKPFILLMLLTGLIPSELSGLQRHDVTHCFLQIRQTVYRGELRFYGRTEYRLADIPITRKIRAVLDELLARPTGSFFITSPSGEMFSAYSLYKKWSAAVAEAGIPHRDLYSLRHTFPAWCQTIGIPIVRIVALMRHGSKQMVYERYGRYVLGLQRDTPLIKVFFGEDFLNDTAGDTPQPSADESERRQ